MGDKSENPTPCAWCSPLETRVAVGCGSVTCQECLRGSGGNTDEEALEAWEHKQSEILAKFKGHYDSGVAAAVRALKASAARRRKAEKTMSIRKAGTVWVLIKFYEDEYTDTEDLSGVVVAVFMSERAAKESKRAAVFREQDPFIIYDIKRTWIYADE